MKIYFPKKTINLLQKKLIKILNVLINKNCFLFQKKKSNSNKYHVL